MQARHAVQPGLVELAWRCKQGCLVHAAQHDSACRCKCQPRTLPHPQFRFTLTGTITLVFERPTATAIFAGLEPATQVRLPLLRFACQAAGATAARLLTAVRLQVPEALLGRHLLLELPACCLSEPNAPLHCTCAVRGVCRGAERPRGQPHSQPALQRAPLHDVCRRRSQRCG